MILNPWIGNGYVCPTSCSLEGMFSSMRQLNINQAQVMDPEKKGINQEETTSSTISLKK